MSFVIRIEWLGSMEERRPSLHEGRFISDYDPDAHNGLGQVWTTAKVDKAKKFNTWQEATSFHYQTSSIVPKRDDGLPNRPLTMYTVSFMSEETAKQEEARNAR